MAISDRIESIEQHLKEDYDVLNLAGADLTNVDKNIVNLKPTWKERLLYFINNGTDEVWNNWDKVTGEGTSLTLNNTLEAKMKIVLKGNTYQEGKPTPDSPIPIQVVSGDNSIEVCGKNLAPTDWSSKFVSAVNVSSQAYLTIKDNRNCLRYQPNTGYGSYPTKNFTLGMTFKENTQYTISYDIFKEGAANRTVGIYYTDGTYSANTDVKSADTWEHQTVTSTAGKTISYIAPFYTAGNTFIDIDTWQIEEGTQATTYESYKGASYPISLGDKELCKIGTYQDKIDKSSGKNLFEYEYILAPNGNNKNAHLKQGTYTISTESGNNFGTNIYFKLFDSNGNAITTSGHLTSSNAQINFSTSSYNYYGGSGSSYIIFTIDNDYTLIIGQLNADGTKRVMLNEGSTALPYEPYGTGWYLKKEIGKDKLSSSNVVYHGVSNNIYQYELTPTYTPVQSQAILSTHFTHNTGTQWWTYNNNIVLNTSSNAIHIYMTTNQYANITEFNNFTSSNDVYVYYSLSTPTYEPITDTTLLGQLEALEKGKSYTGQTNLSQTSNDLASIMSVVALSE